MKQARDAASDAGFRYGHSGSKIRTGAAASAISSPTKDRDWSDPTIYLAQRRTALDDWAGFSLPTMRRG